MRWRKEDLEKLKRDGFDEKDIKQIRYSGKFLKLTTKLDNGKEVRLTQNKAIEILGKDTFISGMERSAFHFTSSRSNNGVTIFFDCSNMFR